MFSLDYKKNEFYLMFEGNAVDRFDIRRIAINRMKDANRILANTNTEGHNNCGNDPVVLYQVRYNIGEKMEFISKTKAKQEARNNRANKRGERGSGFGRNPLL